MASQHEEGKEEDPFRLSILKRRKVSEFTQKILSMASSSAAASINMMNNNHSLFLRRLYQTEVDTLEKECGCTCKDWSNVFLLLSGSSGGSSSPSRQQQKEDQSQRLRQLVTHNYFEGRVILEMSICESRSLASTTTATTTATTKSTTKLLEPYSNLPIGIHNNLLIGPNTILSTQSWIYRSTVIRDTRILSHSVVVGCGSVVVAGTDSLWQNDGQLHISVGAESGGGRDLIVLPESDMIGVCQQLTGRKIVGNLPTQSNKSLKDDDTNYAIKMNIIGQSCLVRDTPTIQNIYLDVGSSIQAASYVSNVIMLPSSTIQNACTVENVRCQWDSVITDSSNVTETLLMEQSQIGPNSLVASSVLGPDVHVSAGEVHCSVIGPNTNSHHQSLVISVLWPLGRGNVGYGANIGSNHTGRIPDQETTSGEGVFWGLSAVIKFPVDMTLAPYSIIAAGTTVPPQRVCMPFSLIVTGTDGSSNNIIPGWVLSSSPYTIARSEKKYATRRKALRHKHYTGWKIIRPETIGLCQWARKQLLSVQQHQQKASKSDYYATEKAVPGIGSNVLSEKGRQAGIKAYTDCVQRFALGGLLQWLMTQQQQQSNDRPNRVGPNMVDLMTALKREFDANSLFTRTSSSPLVVDDETTYKQVAWPLLPWETSSSPLNLWQFQKKILVEEFPLKKGGNGQTVTENWVTTCLQRLVQLENTYADKIYKCKKRDDQRGAQTIPGYAASHKAAEIDPVVKEAKKTAEVIETSVDRYIVGMSKIHRSKL